MARLDPAAQQLDERALPTPYDTPNVSADSQGAAIGGAVEQAGGVIGEIAKRAKHQADSDAVIGAQGQAQNALNSIVLNPNTGFRSLKGEAAIAGRDPAAAALDKALQDISGQLANSDQKREFLRHALVIRESGLRNILHHDEIERQNAGAANYLGAQDAAMQTLGLVATDAAERDKTLETIGDQAIRRAKAQFGDTASRDQIASVFIPAMQKAAETTMAGAMAANDPGAARAAFLRVGDLLQPNRRAFFSTTIDKMDADQKVTSTTTAIVAQSVDPSTQTVDPEKALQLLGKLSPADPLTAEVIKQVNQQAAQRETAFSQRNASVAAGGIAEGTDPETGLFSYAKVRAQTKAYLQLYSPADLLKLKQLDARSDVEARRDAAEARRDAADQRREAALTSKENYSSFAAQLHDPDRKAEFLKMTRDQAQMALLDDAQYPGGLLPLDRTRALAEFDKFQKAGAKLDEPVAKTVKEAIAAAIKNKPQRDKFEKQYFGALLDATNAYKENEKPNGISTPKLRAFVEDEMAKQDSGSFFSVNRRRIENEVKAKQDAAKKWLEANPDAPEAAGVRARLKGEGAL